MPSIPIDSPNKLDAPGGKNKYKKYKKQVHLPSFPYHPKNQGSHVETSRKRKNLNDGERKTRGYTPSARPKQTDSEVKQTT